MKVVAIIQARIGSTRLPGKVLCDLAGETMLTRIVRRVKRVAKLDEVWIATSTEALDDVIEAAGSILGVSVFRGSEADVLDRFYQAAKVTHADAVVRITADCPFIEPLLIENLVDVFLDLLPDYASNTLSRSFPRGLDVEIMSFPALRRAWSEATAPHERAHVTPYIYAHPEYFKLASIVSNLDLSCHRWTVDTPEDLIFAQTIYRTLAKGDDFVWTEILDLLELLPALATLNSNVQQKDLQMG